MTRSLNLVAAALATTIVATAAVLAGATVAFAGHGVQAQPDVRTVQLERVVVSGKRLPQGE